MQAFTVLFEVVFVLSTIVFVTDCCSSRIVLLKDQSLNVVEKVEVLQQNAQPTFSVFSNENLTASQELHNNSTKALNITEKSLLDPGSKHSSEVTPLHASEFNSDPSVRAQQTGNPNYHVIDYYYHIMRDVTSFECSGQFLTEFCLNKGRCFRYPIGNHSFFSCECADGFVGERCESKSLNEVFTPMPPPRLYGSHISILSARTVFSFPMLIAMSSMYLIIAATIVFRCPQKDVI